jgi:polysaccharide pyruvyl transferase WcaK-like protein
MTVAAALSAMASRWQLLQEMLTPDFADRIHSMPVTLDSWEIKALSGQVDLVLTGRMHLAIAALGMGTPAFCTVYQGKFEGLMQMFELEGMTITPSRMDSAEWRCRAGPRDGTAPADCRSDQRPIAPDP